MVRVVFGRRIRLPVMPARLLAGASTLVCKGEIMVFSANGSEAGNLMLQVGVEIRGWIFGACSADVFASVKLDVEASGASEVQYRDAAAVTQDVNVPVVFGRRFRLPVMPARLLAGASTLVCEGEIMVFSASGSGAGNLMLRVSG